MGRIADFVLPERGGDPTEKRTKDKKDGLAKRYAKNKAKKAGTKLAKSAWLLLGNINWSWVGIAFLVFIVIATTVTSASSVTAVTHTAKESVVEFTEKLKFWEDDPDTASDISDEDAEKMRELVDGDKELTQLKDSISQCAHQGQDAMDPPLSAAIATVDKGTDADLAMAWLMYVAGTLEGRSALLFHHPELKASYEGTVLSPEDFQKQGLKAYSQQEFYGYYEQYKANVGDQATPADFVSRLSKYPFPESFENQLRAAMWMLTDTGVVTDVKGSYTIDKLMQSCGQDW